MDVFGLGVYGSDDEEAKDKASTGAGSDSEDDSDASSIDSAQERALEAEARLKDYGEPVVPRKQDGAAASLLPGAAAVFDEVDGPPSFLDPEAIRPLAMSSAHMGGGLLIGAGESSTGDEGPDKSRIPGKDFDISRLAPLLKGQKRNDSGRDLPSGALIEGKAKRYKPDGPEATQQYTALQIAAMGGKVPERLSAGAAGGGGEGRAAPGPTPPPDVDGKKGGRSEAMPVSEFLAGGSVLPRKAQDRRDKEKLKRQKGQSGVSTWKTEAEMVLRQQYDS